MKSTVVTDQYRELLDREHRGDFGEEGLGPYIQWLGDNWKKVRELRSRVASSLLAFVGTVDFTPIGKFLVRDHFKVDTSDTAVVKISRLGDSFKARFLDHGHFGIGESSLYYYDLRKDSTYIPIATELGGMMHITTRLGQIYALMARQSSGRSGVLLTNGYGNIFYTYDVNEALRAVCVGWNGDGWSVVDYSIWGQCEVVGTSRVFSCIGPAMSSAAL